MHMITVRVICVLYAEQAVPGHRASEAVKLSRQMCGAWRTVLKSMRQK